MRPLRNLAILIVLALALPINALAADLTAIARQANEFREELIASVVGADPQTVSVRLIESGTAAAKGRWEEAATKLGEAIGLGREDRATWLTLSDFEEKAGYPARAVSAAFQAYLMGAGEERGQALLRVAGLLDRAGQREEAVIAYDQALRLVWDSDASNRAEELRQSLAFHAVNSRLNATGETPEACIEFQGALLGTDSIRYEDYVKIEPQVEATFVVSDSTLCIRGIDFGQSYTVKLLEGLPSADSGELAKPEDWGFTVGDRDPSIGFRNQAYVLPKIGSTGVPVITVNVDRVSLRLMRINDRNLINEVYDGRFLTNLEGYSREQIVERSGELVWEGSMDIQLERNKRVVTAFPIDEVAPQTKPGIYVLMASKWHDKQADGEDESERWEVQATQWLVVTDIGLTTFVGANGLDIATRSLETGRPVGRIDVKLIARNNEVLAQAVTDRKGLAHFDPGLLRGEGGRTATAVMAFRKDGDFSFIDLTRSAFDLSDRGVAGRAAPGEADLFFYTDRGVYRPGETVHLMALLRDQAAKAITDNLPLTFRVLRPDGVEAATYGELKGDGGGFQLDIPIASSARTGNWTVEAYLDPEGKPIASTEYLVEEVVPARIETTVTPVSTTLVPGAETPVDVVAKFLYGAPAAGLTVKADLTIAQNFDPFPQYPGYHFDLADEGVEASRIAFDDARTDDDGRASFSLALDDLPETTQPLSANLRVEVYEFGGRPVIKSVALPIKNRNLWVGVKPLFENDQTAMGATAQFEIMALDGDGRAIAKPGLSYRLVKEDWDYQWYYSENTWDYNVVVRDDTQETGKLDVAAEKPAMVEAKVDWGHYRLEVFDPESGSASSVRFYAGWWAQPGTAGTPDKMQVVAEKELYQVGEDAAVHLQAPFTGTAMVTIATDRVLETRQVDMPPEGKTIHVEVDPSWGAGAYVLVNAFRPGEAEQHGPGRAIGLTWLQIDAKPRQLRISMTVPDKVLPRQSVEIPVAVDNLSDTTAYLTLAAVDEGILQLTDFTTPDPLGYYFGKRRLGLDLRDVYGQLIDGKEGKRGDIREGGDDAGLARRGAPPEIKLVALFSGLVKLDGGGKASVRLDIPDYNGRLRLMAVAYDGNNVGSAEAGLVVRDPVVALVSAPRFMAPGDESYLSLSIQNLDGTAGDYHVALSAAEAVQLGDGANFTASLPVGATKSQRIPMLGKTIGNGEITLAINGPNGYELSRAIQVPVRPAQSPTAQTLSKILAPGESLDLGADALADFLPGTSQLRSSFSTRPNLDVQSVLANLSHYPYGCLEQTTSVAFPLLFTNELADLWDLKNAYAGSDTEQLQKAVNRAFERQRSDGMFSLWDGSGPAYKWLSAYAMDFLTEAKARGYHLSEFGYRNGLQGLRLIATDYNSDDPSGLNARAYALYVLAKAKAASLSDLRYLFDAYLDRLPTPIASAQLGAALAMSGDMERAEKAFAKARIDAERAAGGYWDYGSEFFGSNLRDMAALVTLMTEAKMPNGDVAPLLDRLAGMQSRRSYLSTQEEAWILRAARATASADNSMSLGFADRKLESLTKPFFAKTGPEELAKGIRATNNGSGPIYAKVTASGIPSTDLPASDSGFSIERKVFTIDGQEVKLDQIRQNDIVVVVIRGQVKDYAQHQAMIVDLLPAGLEIENERLTNTRRTGDLAWLPELTELNYSEFLDDRFVAAFDIREQSPTNFALSYMARAVTPGEYKLPAIAVEDMYNPEIRGRSASDRIVVLPYQ